MATASSPSSGMAADHMTTSRSSSASARGTGSRGGRRRPIQEQRFSSYLTFGSSVTLCLGVFIVLYAMVLLILSPLLVQDPPHQSEIRRGQVLAPVVQPWMDTVKHMHQELSGQALGQEMVMAIKKQLHAYREKEGVSDASLLEKAKQDFERLRQARKDGRDFRKEQVDAANEGGAVAVAGAKSKKMGFMVLGMHRSGTSMMSGLLVHGFGYHVGGPLIGGAFDNPKGFFERLDVVLQNDEFMQLQQIWWSANVINYDYEQALADKESGKATFTNGRLALEFLNNPDKAPWLQKDPRMCICLKTWLKLLTNEPAIVFTYRHPLEVAMSLKKREKNFPLELGLRLWIVYNMRAIQNSVGLCIVYTSNDALLANPLVEIQRISTELTMQCGVPAPPRDITKEDVDKFVDPNLQHHNKQRELEDQKRPVLVEYDGCPARDYQSDLKPGTPAYEREHELYLKAMRIYCDFKSKKAYKEGYEWPQL